MSNWKNKAKFLVRKQILKARRLSGDESILIFSEPRSGSTWLAELLHHIPGTLIHWEPLHVEKGIVPKYLNWSWRPYLPKGQPHLEAKAFLETALSLRDASSWTIHYVSLNKARHADLIINKWVRGLLLIPWMLEHLTLQRPPIVLLRHPISTCQSQIKNFSVTLDQLPLIPFPQDEARYLPHLSTLEKCETVLELKIAHWLINTLPLLNDEASLRQCHLVYYEQLLTNPQQELKRLLSALRLDHALPQVLAANIHRASGSDYQQNFESNTATQLNKAIDQLMPKEQQRIQQLFDYFGFTHYDAFSSLPR
ncbi:MAG: sulfotransferase [Bacteroidota bacterium]